MLAVSHARFSNATFPSDSEADAVVTVRRISSPSFGGLRNLPTFPSCWNSTIARFDKTLLEKELPIGILQWCGICQTGLAVVLQNPNRWRSVPKIFYSVAIPSSIERVWSIIRDFNDFPSWHPEVYDSSIEDNRLSDAGGCVRSLYLKGGGHFRERLLALSDREHKFTYTILELGCNSGRSDQGAIKEW